MTSPVPHLFHVSAGTLTVSSDGGPGIEAYTRVDDMITVTGTDETGVEVFVEWRQLVGSGLPGITWTMNGPASTDWASGSGSDVGALMLPEEHILLGALRRLADEQLRRSAGVVSSRLDVRRGYAFAGQRFIVVPKAHDEALLMIEAEGSSSRALILVAREEGLPVEVDCGRLPGTSIEGLDRT